MPGPIVFGALIDMACQLWQTSCGGEGSCFFYDNQALSLNLLAVNLAFNVGTIFFIVLAMLLYKGVEYGDKGTELHEHVPGNIDKVDLSTSQEVSTVPDSIAGAKNGGFDSIKM